jgi:hypothetical protein
MRNGRSRFKFDVSRFASREAQIGQKQSVEKHCNALPTITHAHPHKLTQNVREKIKKIKKNNR